MILRLRYVQQFRDRHGHERLYFRRAGCKPIRLPARTDPGFHAAYAAANAASVPRDRVSRVEEGSLEALVRSYQRSAHYRQLGDTTRAVYARILKALCIDHGTKPARLLDAAHIRRLIAARSDTPASANHLLRTFRALMDHAVEEGWRKDNPADAVKRLREKGEGAETWSEEDIAAFEAHWRAGTRPRLALALALLYTGQRRSDVVRMGRQHVRSGSMEVHQVKTGARLLIPLHAELAALIEREKDRLTFLVTAAGAPFTPNGFYMRFRAWVAAAGLPTGRSPHGLRKAAARRLAEAGCTAHQIAAVTGHKTLSEVQRYTRAADQEDLARQAVARIGGRKTERA